MEGHTKSTDARATDGAGSPADALAAVGQALVKAAKPPSGTADPCVAVAFSLGWQMAELYRPGRRRKIKQTSQDDLPALGSLDEIRRLEILVDQVRAGLAKLGDPLERAGFGPFGLADLSRSLTQQTERRQAVRQLHLEVLGALTAADFRLGKAYGLGRALADTCRKPADAAEIRTQLRRARIANLLGWFDDLSSALPAHAGHSVATSIARWRDWAQEWTDDGSSLSQQDALQLLRRQGELWRALLSGEKQGGEMLEIDNWVDVAHGAMRRLARMGRGLLLRMPLLSLLIVVLFGGGVWLMLHKHTSSSIVAGAGGILASLGLTWKGLGGSLGPLAAKLEQPLVGAATDEAIADAITLLPKRRYRRRDRRNRRRLALEMATIDPDPAPEDA